MQQRVPLPFGGGACPHTSLPSQSPEVVEEAFFALDRDLRVIYTCTQGLKMTGRPRGTCAGYRFGDLVCSSLAAFVHDACHRAVCEGGRVSREEFAARLGAWFRIVVVPTEEGFSLYLQDVTQARGAECQRLHTEERYEALARATGAVVWITDAEGRMQDSPEWRRITGQSAEDCVGHGWTQAVHPEDRAPAGQAWSDAVARREPYETDYRLRMADGAYRWHRDRGVPLFDEAGEIVQWIGICENIHDRKLAEFERDRFFTVGVDLMCVGGFDGVIRKASPKWTEVLGWSVEELTSRPWMEFVHPDDVEATLAQWRANTSGEAAISFENRYRTKDGRYRWLSWRVRPYLEEGLTYCAATDITERKAAEAAIHLTARQYQATFDNAAVGIAHVGLDGSWIRINEALAKIVGYTIDELLDRTFADITHPEDVDEDWDGARRLAAGEIDRYSMEKRYIRKDGAVVWVNLTVSMMRDRAGAPVHYISIVEDIDARKQAERSLRESEDHYRFMVDFSPQMPWIADPAGRVTDVSAAWCRRTGMTPEGALAGEAAALMHPDELEALRSAMARSVASGEPLDLEHRVWVVEGGYRWMRSRAIPRRNEAGEIIRWYGTTEDIHERKILELELESLVELKTAEIQRQNAEITRARDAALAASKAKSEFLANVSHEIRTPMNGVIGMTSLLLERDLDPETREMVATVASSGETLLRVIDDVLDLSKIEAGKLDIERTRIDLSELAADVVALYQGHAQSKGVALRCVGDGAVPPRVLADPVRLRQVLANLVSNAVKFTEHGEVSLNWDWRTEGSVVSVTFEVRDTGIGIPPERLDAIFESFAQADGSTHRKYGGTGLGLTISKRLVGLMGGELSVASEVDRGTVFTVSLTLEVAPVWSEPEKDDEVTLPMRPLRVLLAEDNAVNVQVARRLLERQGCTVDVVDNGLRAIACAASGGYDLILMDVQMPICDGLEASRVIRQAEVREGKPRLPIYALTANVMSEDRAECLAAGMDGFLAKPIRPADIQTALAAVADRFFGPSDRSVTRPEGK